MNHDDRSSHKSIYHKIYYTHVKSAIETCRSITAMSHGGEKGRIREILIRQLFRPLLPADLGIGTGIVVASAGENNGWVQSAQQDIVLYDRSTLPPALFDQETGVFPIESVLFTIEVKSCLDRSELETAHRSAKNLKSFFIHDQSGQVTKSGLRPTSTIFTLDSDLTGRGKSEIERYDEVRGEDKPCLDAHCIVGRGYWWYQNGVLRNWPERQEFSEVIGFISHLLNALPMMYEERRAARPPIGVYLNDVGRDLDHAMQIMSKLPDEAELHVKEGNYGAVLADLDTYANLIIELHRFFDLYKGEEFEAMKVEILESIRPTEQLLRDAAARLKNQHSAVSAVSEKCSDERLPEL